MSFLPYSKLHALVVIVTSDKYFLWCKHSNSTMQTIPNHCYAKLKIVHRTNNLKLNNFKIFGAMGLKIITSRSPLIVSPPYQFIM
jgi:hypothetical protein